MKALASLGSVRHYGVLAQDTDADFQLVKLNFSHSAAARGGTRHRHTKQS